MWVRIGSKAVVAAATALVVAGLAWAPAPLARAAAAPARVAAAAVRGSFYRYTGSTPLAQIPPGTVLKTRVLATE